jgi:outer membrane protein OmpA-like peptidoglycan-associated protein
VRDYAYVACRRAQIAEVAASIESSTQQQILARRVLRQSAEEESTIVESRAVARRAIDNVRELLSVEEGRATAITGSSSVLFEPGQSAVLPAASAILDLLVDALGTIEDRGLIIEGHTDSSGSELDNETLSLDRALRVRDYLLSRGLEITIEAVGFGSSRPAASNATREGRSNNRRVEIILVPNRY